MNSINNREWEIYNFENIGGTTEYNNVLINKDIDNYFNQLITKNNVETKSNIKIAYTFDKFYGDYIEHNLLFIVLLIGIIIFLVIRQYIKDFDTFESDSENNNKNNSNLKNENIHINKIKSKNFKNEKKKLIQFKKELDYEKQKILSIIDELSNINDYQSNIISPNQQYLDNYNSENSKNFRDINISEINGVFIEPPFI